MKRKATWMKFLIYVGFACLSMIFIFLFPNEKMFVNIVMLITLLLSMSYMLDESDLFDDQKASKKKKYLLFSLVVGLSYVIAILIKSIFLL